MNAIMPSEFSAASNVQTLGDDNIIFRSYFEQFNALVAGREFRDVRDGFAFVQTTFWPKAVRLKICEKYAVAGWDASVVDAYLGGPYVAIRLKLPA